LLGHLNGYNRSTADGKRTAVNLCVYTQQQRVAVVEGKIRRHRAPNAAEQETAE
jgi:hypothetical protein